MVFTGCCRWFGFVAAAAARRLAPAFCLPAREQQASKQSTNNLHCHPFTDRYGLKLAAPLLTTQAASFNTLLTPPHTRHSTHYPSPTNPHAMRQPAITNTATHTHTTYAQRTHAHHQQTATCAQTPHTRHPRHAFPPTHEALRQCAAASSTRERPSSHTPAQGSGRTHANTQPHAAECHMKLLQGKL